MEETSTHQARTTKAPDSHAQASWKPRGISMGIQRQSHGSPREGKWISHRNTQGFPLNTISFHENPPVWSHGSLVETQWTSLGAPCEHHGSPTEVPNPMALLYVVRVNSIKAFGCPMGIPSKYRRNGVFHFHRSPMEWEFIVDLSKGHESPSEVSWDPHGCPTEVPSKPHGSPMDLLGDTTTP